MVSAAQIIVYFILILVVTTVVFYIVLGSFSGGFAFIGSRLSVAGKTLASLGETALIQGRNILGEAIDFAVLMESDINRVLVAATDAFAQILETLGIAMVDLINFLALYFQARNSTLMEETTGFFEGLLAPLTDTLKNVIDTVTKVAVALIGTFDPTKC
jgi:hypothetical protein